MTMLRAMATSAAAKPMMKRTKIWPTAGSGAKKRFTGREVREALGRNGILVRAPNDAAIAEEAPSVYKPSAEVVRVVHEAGLGRLVARLRPIGVIKG